MKKINISVISKANKNSIRTAERKHSVFLHSGSTYYFSDLKQARAFLVSVNEFLTFQFFLLNEVYIETFTHYRRAWFYMDLPQEAAIKNNIAIVNNAFQMSFDRSAWINGAPNTFRNYAQACGSLQGIIEVLQDLHRRRGNYAEIRILGALSFRIRALASQVEKWPEQE